MSLLKIKQYLQNLSRAASLHELALHFSLHPELARQLVTHWARKGKVRICQKTAACGVRCQRCVPEMIEMYEWIV